MAAPRSRLQLIADLRELEQAHTAAAAAVAQPAAVETLLERYSYGELQTIADFLTADTARLRGN